MLKYVESIGVKHATVNACIKNPMNNSITSCTNRPSLSLEYSILSGRNVSTQIVAQ